MRWLIMTTLAAFLMQGIATGDPKKGDKGKDNGNGKAKIKKNGDDRGRYAAPGWNRGGGSWNRGGYWNGGFGVYDPYWTNGFDDDGYSDFITSRPATGFARTTGSDLAEMDYVDLRHAVHFAFVDFDRWLSGIPAGDVWRKHFDTISILEMEMPHPDDDEDGTLTTNEREAVVLVLDSFDKAVENLDMRSISQSPSFQRAHAALREFAMPARERLVRQLSASARELNRSLASFNTGARWQRYLALPDSIVAAVDKPHIADQPTIQFDSNELSRVLEKFDEVSRNREYRDITALPAFQMTHDRLAALLAPNEESQGTPTPARQDSLPPVPERDGQ